MLISSPPPPYSGGHTLRVNLSWSSFSGKETPPEINPEACLLDDSIDNEDEPFYCVYLGMKELEKLGATKAWGHQTLQ